MSPIKILPDISFDILEALYVFMPKSLAILTIGIGALLPESSSSSSISSARLPASRTTYFVAGVDLFALCNLIYFIPPDIYAYH